MAYFLRDRKVESYKHLFDGPWLPRLCRKKVDPDCFYPVEILEEDRENHRIRVHYVGYGAESDEWVKEEDTKDIEPSPQVTVKPFIITVRYYMT